MTWVQVRNWPDSEVQEPMVAPKLITEWCQLYAGHLIRSGHKTFFSLTVFTGFSGKKSIDLHGWPDNDFWRDAGAIHNSTSLGLRMLVHDKKENETKKLFEWQDLDWNSPPHWQRRAPTWLPKTCLWPQGHGEPKSIYFPLVSTERLSGGQ